MNSRISVNAACTDRLSLLEDLEFWGRNSIATVGIHTRKLNTGDSHSIANAGLRVTSLTARGTDLAGRTGWPDYVTRMHSVLDDALTMRAERLVLTTGSAGPLQWEKAAKAWKDLVGEFVAESPVRVLVEHTSPLRTDVSFVHSLRDAVDLARDVGVGVLMDINSCWMERNLSRTIRKGLDVIGLVQVGDTAAAVHSSPDRAVPGDGVIPLERIVRDLVESGYPGPFELEILGPRIEQEGYASAVPRGMAALDSLLSAIGLGT